MLRSCFAIACFGALLAGCAGPQIYKANDTGGIISWSPEAEEAAPRMAADYCAGYGKYARMTSLVRGYGNYIGFSCGFERFPPARNLR